MFSPDRLIGKLISNISLSMREKYWQLKGISVLEGEKKVCCLSSLCRHTNVSHSSVVQLQEETA